MGRRCHSESRRYVVYGMDYVCGVVFANPSNRKKRVRPGHDIALLFIIDLLFFEYDTVRIIEWA